MKGRWDDGRFREAEGRMWASVGVEPTERRLKLERSGTTIRVQETGEGPDVVFIHGANNGGTSWASLVAQLDGFHCVLLDRPGCGLSDPADTVFTGPDHLGAFAEGVVLDVLDGMGLDSAHLVATSYGGYFALRAAAAHPERVQRLVEYGWTLGAPMAKLPAIMRVASLPGLRRLLNAVPPTRGAVRALLGQIGLKQAVAAGRVTDEMVDWYHALLRHTPTVRQELAATVNLLSPTGGLFDSLTLPPELLARIEAPTFLLWGDGDPFGGADVARTLAAQVPGAELELLAGAGHAVWMDDPVHVGTATQAFLAAP
jgi:pimeloyl-ACP methyl ester carboxylesterase